MKDAMRDSMRDSMRGSMKDSMKTNERCNEKGSGKYRGKYNKLTEKYSRHTSPDFFSTYGTPENPARDGLTFQAFVERLPVWQRISYYKNRGFLVQASEQVRLLIRSMLADNVRLKEYGTTNLADGTHFDPDKYDISAYQYLNYHLVCKNSETNHFKDSELFYCGGIGLIQVIHLPEEIKHGELSSWKEVHIKASTQAIWLDFKF